MNYILDSSLVLRLPLYQLNGASFMSQDACGHLCTRTGAFWTPRGWSFDGNDDYIDIVNALTLLKTSVGTVIAWIKVPDATPEEADAVVTFGDTDGIRWISTRVQTTGKLYADCYNTAARWILETDNAVFSDDTWACMAITHNGTAPVLYVNGSSPAQTFSNETDKTLWIGGVSAIDNAFIGKLSMFNNANQMPFGGLVGEVIAYSRALSALEIQHNYLTTKWRYR